ncbi:MFS transporter, partial [Enterococcus hirae]
GVYPPGMKAMATWFRAGRGLALGVMVGALTLGSSLPHLVNGLGGRDADVVIVTTAVLTVVGGVVAVTVPDGPFPFPRAPFHPR